METNMIFMEFWKQREKLNYLSFITETVLKVLKLKNMYSDFLIKLDVVLTSLLCTQNLSVTHIKILKWINKCRFPNKDLQNRTQESLTCINGILVLLSKPWLLLWMVRTFRPFFLGNITLANLSLMWTSFNIKEENTLLSNYNIDNQHTSALQTGYWQCSMYIRVFIYF